MNNVYEVGLRFAIGAIENPGHAREHGGDDVVDQRDSVSGDAGQRSAALVLGTRAGGQAETGEAVHEREPDGEHQHDPGEEDPVARESETADRHRRGRKDRRRGLCLGAEIQDGDGLKDEHHPD